MCSDVLGIKPEVIVSSSVRPDGDEVDVIISWISQVSVVQLSSQRLTIGCMQLW